MQWIKNMLGFIVEQPLHLTLRQMRLVQVGVVINSQMLLWYICDIMTSLDATQAAIGLTAVMLAEVAAIWKCVDALRLPTNKDEVHIMGSTQLPPKKTEENTTNPPAKD